MDCKRVELGLDVAIYASIMLITLVPMSPIYWLPEFEEGNEELDFWYWFCMFAFLFVWLGMLLVGSACLADKIRMFKYPEATGEERARQMRDMLLGIIFSGCLLVTLLAAFTVWWIGLISGLNADQQFNMFYLICFLVLVTAVTRIVFFFCLCNGAPSGTRF